MDAPITDTMPNPLAEPLETGAVMARSLARSSCPPGPRPAACAAFHGFWPSLRLMGLAMPLNGFADAFVQALRAQMQARAPRPARVLIGGCADQSALAHVAAAAQGLPGPNLTVLDICRTPLALSRWLARERGLQIGTVCRDILDYRPGPCLDIVIASDMLGHFTPVQRRALFDTIAAMLAPGGELLLSTRLLPGAEDQPLGPTDEHAGRLVEAVEARRGELPAALALSTVEARRMAIDYLRSPGTYPVNGEATVRALAERAGLTWVAGMTHGAGSAGAALPGGALLPPARLFARLGKLPQDGRS